MNRKLKKICIIAVTLAITATSAMSMSLSADCLVLHSTFTDFSDFTVIDDKGMLRHDGDNHEGYKTLYRNNCLYRAEPQFGYLQFVLSEDVDYEEVNERVIEIFEEFYPDNYLGVSTDEMDYLEYSKNYKPNIWSKTVDGVTTYTVCANNKHVHSIEDEKVAAARKYSKAFMKKLNDEKLISAFYDFGEVYIVNSSSNWMLYTKNDNIDLINNYIKENNIDCTIEDLDDYYYILKSNDGDTLKSFLIAADIYKATSIGIEPINDAETASTTVYGKNALEDLTKIGNANEDETIDIRDAAFIARKVAQRKVEELPEWADYNNDSKLDILDAAAIARDVARRILN